MNKIESTKEEFLNMADSILQMRKDLAGMVRDENIVKMKVVSKLLYELAEEVSQ